MKKFSFLFAFLLVASFANAQKMTEWNWATYKMKFQAPADFKISENNAEKFSAGNQQIDLTIYPRKGENLSYEDMEGNLTSWAADNNVSYEGEAQYMENLNGYWGVYIDGEADGYPTSLLLLVDPDYPEISLYVWISYEAASEATAIKILKSFKLN